MQKSDEILHEEQNGLSKKKGTRIHNVVPPDYDPKKPRLGRRESEPHSAEVSYLFDVLQTNFKNDRVMWDLHHYFPSDYGKIDIQFDISYFKDFILPYELTSYKSIQYENRVPNMAVNVLSKSSWKVDIGEHVDQCKILKIPVYLTFPTYHVATNIYKPPFLRAYLLQSNGEYKIQELHNYTMDENGNTINKDEIIDTGDLLPFRLGILKRKVKFEGNLPTFHIILIKPDTFERFPTLFEKEKKRADDEKKRADDEKKRANDEKKRADDEKKRADDLSNEIGLLKDKIKKLEEL